MERQESMKLGVVVERRDSRSRWQDYDWTAVAVIPGAPPVADMRMLRAGPGWVQFHAATLDLDLFHRETEGYKVNMSGETPAVYVVLRQGEEADEPDVVPFCVTVCPYEAQDYLDAGDCLVEAVAMPDSVLALVKDFVDQHHVDVPFVKRKQKRQKGREESGPGRHRRLDRG